MKKILCLLLFFGSIQLVSAQFVDRYTSSSLEVNVSSALITKPNGNEENATARFAPWFNMQVYRNWDVKLLGFFAGFTVRNIGFIYEQGPEKWKARTYNAGIPVGLKIGSMKGIFIYGGYEFEVPFHYKEKYFLDDSKERKTQVWLSKKVSPFTHSVFFGFNLPKGFNIKFKYYLTEFFDPNYNNQSIADTRDIRYPGNGLLESDPDYIAPRDYLKVNIFYVTVSFNMFKKPKSRGLADKKDDTETVY